MRQMRGYIGSRLNRDGLRNTDCDSEVRARPEGLVRDRQGLTTGDRAIVCTPDPRPYSALLNERCLHARFYVQYRPCQKGDRRVRIEYKPKRCGLPDAVAQEGFHLRADIALPVAVIPQVALAKIVGEEQCVLRRRANDVCCRTEEASDGDRQRRVRFRHLGNQQTFLPADLQQCITGQLVELSVPSVAAPVHHTGNRSLRHCRQGRPRFGL